jgi:hypothetical protein
MAGRIRVAPLRFVALAAVFSLLVPAAASTGTATAQTKPGSVLLLWAGDKGTGPILENGKEYDAPDDEDFLAVMDSDRNSPEYGKILKTLSLPTGGPGNEPHHLQPFTPPGCHTLFGGMLFSDFWYQFDISDPLNPTRSGTITPAATVGTVPDAAFILPNCEALGTEMGGDPGTGSYVGGPHGTVIRMNPDGSQVLETQMADRVPKDQQCMEQWNQAGPPNKPGGPFTRKTDVNDCLPSNPHGIWARPDLNELVTSDFASPGRLIQAEPPTSDAGKMTVRHYHLDPACTGKQPTPAGTDCMKDPRVVLLPDGVRNEGNEAHKENVAVMETALASGPGEFNPTGQTPANYIASKAGFAMTMCGGAMFYSTDVTAEEPVWRIGFDYSTAGRAVNPGTNSTSGCSGPGGIAPTPDNRFLVQAIIGREPGQSASGIGASTYPNGFPGMLVKMDISKLMAAGPNAQCNIDTTEEVWTGGKEADCPTLAAVHVVDDLSTGGPHFFSYDYPNFNGGSPRLAYFNYFVSETGQGGDLRVCMLDFDKFTLDPGFPKAVDGQAPGSGCIQFNRANWPDDRGEKAGAGKPHYGLFANTG